MKHAAMAAGLGLGLMSGAASAAPLKFEFSGNTSSNDQIVFSFNLNSSPVPDFFIDDAGFQVDNVAVMGSVSGSVPETANENIAFQVSAIGGGLVLSDSSFTFLYAYNGPALFTGYVGNPIFKTGTFTLSGGTVIAGGIDPDTFSTGQLTISAVPLPATAPMFGAAVLALGAVGCGLKRRKAVAAAA